MNNSIEIYRSQDGSVQLNVKLENETVWLTQSQMAELFGVDRTSIVRHIRNIYKSKELEESSTCAKNAQVRIEGQRQIVREIPYYNLDMIISVGYRVNSKNGNVVSSLGDLRPQAISHQGLCHQSADKARPLQRAEGCCAPYVACCRFAGQGYNRRV